MPKLPVVNFTNFGGGVNKLVSASRCKDNESPDLMNIEHTEDGLPSKRRGSVVYADVVGTNGKGLGSLYQVGARYSLKIANSKFYKIVANAWSEITAGGVTFGSGNVNFLQALDALYILDGGVIKKWTGSVLSNVASSPSVAFGIFFNNRIVTSGDITNPSRLHFSASNTDSFAGSAGTATSGSTTAIVDTTKNWTVNQFSNLTVVITQGTNTGQSRVIQSNTSNTLTLSSAYGTAIDNTSVYEVDGGDTLDVSKNDGQAVIALGKYEEKLLVFKERSTYQLTFDSTGEPIVQMISGFVGCVSHRSVESVENDIFYLSQDGVRTFGYVANIPNVLRTNKLSVKLDPEIQNINTKYYSNCAAIYYDNKYILSFPRGESTVNDRIIVFQLLYGCWTIWNGIYANCFNEFVDSDNKTKLYYADENSGQVYEFLTGYNDGGQAIQAYYFTKQFNLGSFSINKKFYFIDLQIRALTGILGIDVIVDGNTLAKQTALSSTFSRSDGLRVFMFREAMERQDAGSTADLVATDDVRRIKISKKARTIQLKIYNNNIDETFTLMGIAIGAREKSPKNFDSTKVLQ